jgi:hypothetical protein
VWNAIGFVSSGITLVAFLAAVAASIYWRSSSRTENLIRTAQAKDRGALVKNALEFFDIDTSGLSQEQQFQIAVREINARSQRFLLTFILIVIVTVTAIVVSLFSLLWIPSDYDGQRKANMRPNNQNIDSLQPLYGPTPIDYNANYAAHAAWGNLKYCRSTYCDVRVHLIAKNTKGEVLLNSSAQSAQWKLGEDILSDDEIKRGIKPESIRHLSFVGNDKAVFRGGESVSVQIGCENSDGSIQYGEDIVLNARDLHSIFAAECEGDWYKLEAGFDIRKLEGAKNN